MKRELVINGKPVEVAAVNLDGQELSFTFAGKDYVFLRQKGPARPVIVDGKGNHVVRCSRIAGKVQVNIGPLEAVVEVPGVSRSRQGGAGDGGSLKSPMPGKIYKIIAQEGSHVKKGDKILILEAMKMEHTLVAHCDGTLAKIFFNEGDQVEGDVELAAITAEEETD